MPPTFLSSFTIFKGLQNAIPASSVPFNIHFKPAISLRLFLVIYAWWINVWQAKYYKLNFIIVMNTAAANQQSSGGSTTKLTRASPKPPVNHSENAGM
jgi:hypothetical protein